MNKDEATRIAGAVNALRPDWGAHGVLTILADDRLRHRAYGDVAKAFVALALDPASRKPTRIHEDGPWWIAARPDAREVNTSSLIRRPLADDCDVCLRPRADHGPGRNDDHEYRQRNASGHGTPMPDEARARLTQLTTHPKESA